jgi:hypothetical protein
VAISVKATTGALLALAAVVNIAIHFMSPIIITAITA